MISISHKQAQRLINAQLDERGLPDTQWTALQAHLESCAECRAYRQLLLQTERRIRRGLHQRWGGVDGPLVATAKPLAALYHERWVLRQASRRMLAVAVAFLVCVLLAVGISARFRASAQAEAVAASSGAASSGAAAAAATPIPPTPTPSPTPTRVPSDYKGLIAYEYREPAAAAAPEAAAPEEAAAALPAAAGTAAANPRPAMNPTPTPASPGEIFLLNTGAEPSNLTNHPADDHDPAWSPDGEWLAFLSDRGGKDEVYISHLSGAHLTQLTDLPNVTWRGPLSWSADGQMLTLIGERTLADAPTTSVYLVPLDGSNAYPLGKTQGARRAAFSPRTPLLAFSGADAWQGGLAVYNFDPAQEGFVTIDRKEPDPDWGAPKPTSQVDHFAWSADGQRLLFRARRDLTVPSMGSAITEVRLRSARPLEGYDNYAGRFVTSADLNRHFNSVDDLALLSWTGVKNEYAYLERVNGTACQALRVGLTNRSKLSALGGAPFCVEDGLLLTNWQVKDKSVVLIGRDYERPVERGLFVLRFRGDTARIEWLGDARGITGPALLRPQGERLAIDPRPVQVAAEPAPEEDLGTAPALPGPETGALLITTKMGERTLIERVAPASERHLLLNQSTGVNSCPTWSPDRSRIAFFSDREDPDRNWEQLFVMESSGLNAQSLMWASGIGCPRWSPDGRWLAMQDEEGVYVVPSTHDTRAPQYLYDYDTYLSLLSWLPDGRLLVFVDRFRAGEPLLRAYNLSSNRFDSTSVDLLTMPADTYFYNVSVHPNGKNLVMDGMQFYHGEQRAWLYTAALESSAPGARADKITIQSRYRLPDDGGTVVSTGWLPDGRAGYLVAYPEGRRVKAALFALPFEKGRQPQQLAAFEETLNSFAWSPDQRWLTVLTDSGRWVLDLSSAQPAPIWVGPETSGELAW